MNGFKVHKKAPNTYVIANADVQHGNIYRTEKAAKVALVKLQNGSIKFNNNLQERITKYVANHPN